MKRLERLHNASGLPMDPVTRASLWKKVDQATGSHGTQLWEYLGIYLFLAHLKQSRRQCLQHQWPTTGRALEMEYRQLDETEKISWRIKLHENRGVNKHTSDLLKKTWFGSPAVQEAGVVHRRGDEVLVPRHQALVCLLRW